MNPLHQLLANEWLHTRKTHILVARASADRHNRAVAVRTARRANHLFLMYWREAAL